MSIDAQELGTQFTCFPSTKAQNLTPQVLLGAKKPDALGVKPLAFGANKGLSLFPATEHRTLIERLARTQVGDAGELAKVSVSVLLYESSRCQYLCSGTSKASKLSTCLLLRHGGYRSTGSNR